MQYPWAFFQKLDFFNRQVVQVNGEMTMHGVEQPMNIEASVWIQDEELYLISKFGIKLADFQIDIPKIVIYNIAEEVVVTIQMQLSQVK